MDHAPFFFDGFFASAFLAWFQYGDLHFGQTRGSWSVCFLGTQTWPHRSHFQPES